MKIFCERFLELRRDKGISTIALGKALGVSSSTITRWENGTILPSIQRLYDMARYFEVSSDYLLGLTNY